MCPKHCRSSKK